MCNRFFFVSQTLGLCKYFLSLVDFCFGEKKLLISFPYEPDQFSSLEVQYKQTNVGLKYFIAMLSYSVVRRK